MHEIGAFAVSLGLPVGQDLVEEIEGLIFFAEVGIDPAHGVLGISLAQAETGTLLQSQSLVAVVKASFQVSRLPVKAGEDIQFSGLGDPAPRRACLYQPLFVLSDEVLERASLCSGCCKEGQVQNENGRDRSRAMHVEPLLHRDGEAVRAGLSLSPLRETEARNPHWQSCGP